MLAFGSNGSGQLGVGHCNDIWEPEVCKFQSFNSEDVEERVVSVAAGGNHTLLLTSSGRVWASGNNTDGRCGLLQNVEQVDTFQQLDLEGVTSIAATWEASLLVVNRRQIWSCGTGNKGELGQGEADVKSETLTQIPVPEEAFADTAEIVDVVSGVNHVLILTSAGVLFGWGSARKGQLGEDAKNEKVGWKPQRISLPFKPVKIAAGRDFTFVLGRGGEQQLLGILQNFHSGSNISGKCSLGLIAAGWTHLYWLSQLGLHAFGRNDRGQLPPNTLPHVRHFAAGSEHCVTSNSENDELLAWGWGEHGNCGRPLDQRGCVRDRFNIIPISKRDGEEIQQIFAGCATNFIVLALRRAVK